MYSSCKSEEYLLELGFAQNSAFDLQGTDLNMYHSQNILAYPSLFASANFESLRMFLYLRVNCSGDLTSNIFNVLPSLGNLFMSSGRQVEAQACLLLVNKLIFNPWGPFSQERVNTHTSQWTNWIIQEKENILENWMSVDYSPQDPWISVLGKGIQVEKNVISLDVQGEPSPPPQLNYTFLLSQTSHDAYLHAFLRLSLLLHFYKYWKASWNYEVSCHNGSYIG